MVIVAPNNYITLFIGHLPLGIPDGHRSSSGTRVTVTMFGYRKGRVSLSMQENPRCLPTLVVELAMQTNVLQKEMSSGMVRIALECEKRPEKDKTRLLEEVLWTMYCNGKKTGYGLKREATDEDLNVMELLRLVSMGAGVLPGNSGVDGPDGELAYIRAHFERVVGSRDSETLYMLWKAKLVKKGPQNVVAIAIIILMDNLFIKEYRDTPLQYIIKSIT
jgi:uncharacterized protein (TIGR01570 family)